MVGGKIFPACRPFAHLNRHIMTGTGAYFYIVWGIWLRKCLQKQDSEYTLLWPSKLSIPTVVRREAGDGIKEKALDKIQ